MKLKKFKEFKINENNYIEELNSKTELIDVFQMYEYYINFDDITYKDNKIIINISKIDNISEDIIEEIKWDIDADSYNIYSDIVIFYFNLNESSKAINNLLTKSLAKKTKSLDKKTKSLVKKAKKSSSEKTKKSSSEKTKSKKSISSLKSIKPQFFTKKKRKSEDEAIEDKYKENIKRIKRMKKLAAKKFADKTVDISIRNIEAKIKRIEIQVAEKELEILKMRDRKLLMKKDLKRTEERIKKLKELNKK